MTIDPLKTSTKDIFKILTSSVVPRPIAMVSTKDAKGQVNLSPFSFFNVFSAAPPLCVFSPARRGRDGSTKHTLDNLQTLKECTISMVSFEMVHQTSLSSSEYERGVNEYIKAGLTEEASKKISVPYIKESPISFECKVNQIIELSDAPGAGNLVLAEIVMIHVNVQFISADNTISFDKMRLVGRMGSNQYIKAFGESLFDVPKPSVELGIGFDALPEAIKKSTVLSGNDLAQLASVDKLPSETQVNEYKLTMLSDLFIEHQDDSKMLEKQLHQKAKVLINKNRFEDALMCLLSFND